MKIKTLLPVFIMGLLVTVLNFQLGAQTCDELVEYVTSEDFGMTYYSYGSDAIRQVSFHEVSDENYNTYYFAIVQFTSSYTGYIYQVAYDTQINYSMNYMSGAGEAFWAYIQPYNGTLGCAPDF